MTFGVAIYGTNEVTPVDAFNESSRFFKIIKMNPNAQGYYAFRKTSGDEDIDFIKADLEHLKVALDNGKAKDFRMYHESNKDGPWKAAFGFSTKEFGGFFHIDIQYEGDDFKTLILFLEEFFVNNTAAYAIGYKCGDVYDAYHYASGENMLKIFPWENQLAFNKETDGRFKGETRFNSTMLRLVYPLNIINSFHLKIKVGELTLSEVISKNSWGGLKKIDGVDERWLWTVQEELLEQINNELGSHGVLISWKKYVPKKSKILPR
ncbi:hypothetical protein ACMSZT_004557 [Cronobacter dublinensis]